MTVHCRIYGTIQKSRSERARMTAHQTSYREQVPQVPLTHQTLEVSKKPDAAAVSSRRPSSLWRGSGPLASQGSTKVPKVMNFY